MFDGQMERERIYELSDYRDLDQDIQTVTRALVSLSDSELVQAMPLIGSDLGRLAEELTAALRRVA